jgi:hypothetical protein
VKHLLRSLFSLLRGRLVSITKVAGEVSTSLAVRFGIKDNLRAPVARFDFVCRDAYGNVKWTESTYNTVMTAGKTDIIDKYLKGSGYTAAWYMLLKGSGTIDAADTLASHAGWSEIADYTGDRPAIAWGTTSAGSNTATAVEFAIDATVTVAGAGMCSAATGTSGVLYNMSNFGTARDLLSGDTLSVTMTISAS